MRKIKLCLIIALSLIIPIISLVFADNYFGDQSKIYIYNTAKTYASKTFTNVINYHIAEQLPSIEMINFMYNNDNTISSVIINTKEANRMLGLVGRTVANFMSQNQLQTFFEGLKIPFGILISQTLFTGLGPDIPIDIIPMGSYTIDLKTDTSLYGINNTLIEVYILIQIDLQVLIPLRSDKITVDTKLMLVSQIVQGEIPRYYYSSNGSFPYVPEDYIE